MLRLSEIEIKKQTQPVNLSFFHSWEYGCWPRRWMSQVTWL